MTDGQMVKGVIGVKVGAITLTKTRYTREETSHILSISETKVDEEIRDGRLQASCENGIKVKPTKVTAESIVDYYKIILVPKEKWLE